MLSESRWKRDEFIFVPKNSSSEGSHACGVAKPQGMFLLVLFFAPKKSTHKPSYSSSRSAMAFQGQ